MGSGGGVSTTARVLKYGWGFVNVNLRPFYAEGSKSLGFETAEQLGWRLPDHVVVPIASGALLTKIHRAFSELIAIGCAVYWKKIANWPYWMRP